MKHDDLGVRMKRNYENITRYYLPRRTHVVIRVDGRTFHHYTRGCERPFDMRIMRRMDATALELCRNTPGARFAYTQSDEISLLLTDFESTHTELWYEGNIQKIASISASMATAFFNAAEGERHTDEPALFDSRVFTIPDPVEVYNYFVWRQQDATRNSIQMAAQACFRHEELEGKNGSEPGTHEVGERLWQERGINWNDYPAGFKRGRFIEKREVKKTSTYVHKQTGQPGTAEVIRHVWEVIEPPVFTREPEWLKSRIPRQG